MKEQLDILSASATDGFAVSYIHMDPEVDVGEMKDGYGLSGKQKQEGLRCSPEIGGISGIGLPKSVPGKTSD